VPCGGIAVSTNARGEKYFYQAMTKIILMTTTTNLDELI
jgi:hypothetical protein